MSTWSEEHSWLNNPPVQKWNSHSAEERTIALFQFLGMLGIVIYYADFPMPVFHDYVNRMRKLRREAEYHR